jgi:hypothetical protein
MRQEKQFLANFFFLFVDHNFELHFCQGYQHGNSVADSWAIKTLFAFDSEKFNFVSELTQRKTFRIFPPSLNGVFKRLYITLH